MKDIISMDEYFRIDVVRKEFIKKLEAKGYSKETIEKMVNIADKMYNEDRIPYPDEF
ncbi:MAG: hypothetical protein J6A15_08605 [Clostridia bacterium]|nr:hypothetical protein [Clostridia bacterium]MBP3681630.1 hypothetical protein [Clostridia bacterium]